MEYILCIKGYDIALFVSDTPDTTEILYLLSTGL